MRPLAGTEAFQPRSRKQSLVEPSVPLLDAHSTSPVTFFIRRGSGGIDDQSSADLRRGQNTSSVESLADTLEGLAKPTCPNVVRNPQLIMPSIKMPSRRPFTERGKQITNFKILVAGSKGVGKTSLIKSIVQICEDIVHVDSLSTPRPPTVSSSSKDKQVLETLRQPPVFEIYASTRTYPSWWSEIEDARMLRRRRSMGDAVLDRNLCFVDTTCSDSCDTILEYMAMQLQKAAMMLGAPNHDFAALLSGSGGSQVDLVFYMLSKDTLDADISHMKSLSEMTNVIPLLSKADQLTSEHIEMLKVDTRSKLDLAILPRLPAFGASDSQEETGAVSAPYTVSAATGPDHETMDASLLMSPDYVQPLMPSELTLLVQQIFETNTISYLRHSAAKKLIAWQAAHPQPFIPTSSAKPTFSSSPPPTSLTSQLPYTLSNSGVLVPLTSDISLSTTSNSQEAMTLLAEHARQEELLAQVRLSKWANDLQSSLQRERERFEELARCERAIWLVERMGEEARSGRLSTFDQSGALVKAAAGGGLHDSEPTSWPTAAAAAAAAKYSTRDPLGILRWSDKLQTRGWIALQVFGSFGMIGGLAFWLAKTWDLTTAINDWVQGWSWISMGTGWNGTDSALT